MGKLRVLDLFSGIGGFSLGLERTGGFETVAFCEIEEFPRKVLARHWPDVPCFEDVRTLKGGDVGAVDVICGGYPCQPFSTAGKRRGQKDDRHLWPEFNRLVAELRPTWVIGENVAGHISMGLDDVLSDLEGQGYACRTFVIPACAVAAHHRRDRCWTIAHSGDVLHARKLDAGTDCGTSGRGEGSDTRQGQAPHGQRVRAELGTGCEDVADTNPERELQSQGGQQDQRRRSSNCCEDVPNTHGGRPQGQGWAKGCLHSASSGKREINRTLNDRRWPTEPRVGRMANGVPNGVDRLKALGNAVVPQIPEMIGHAILEAAHG